MSADKLQIALDPEIRDWVLLPIMVVMLLIGVLRHYITQILTSQPKTSLKAIRETQELLKARLLRANCNIIPAYAFESRRKYIGNHFEKGTFLKTPLPPPSNNPDEPQMPPNPMSDPAQMEVMMDGMKKNMAMMVPQMLIMGWVNFFFSGFVLIKLPFPLTLRFKAMLQRGIETSEMDVAWVSSLSWYFLNLFGLQNVFGLILGQDNAAGGMKDMQAMASPQQQMQQPQDVHKTFLSEKESLDLVVHDWALDNIEQNFINKFSNKKSAQQKKSD